VSTNLTAGEPEPLRLDGRGRRRDLPLHGVALFAGAGVVVLLTLLCVDVFREGTQAMGKFGAGFITSTEWNPVTGKFGAAYFIAGTAITSAIAIVLACPLAVAIGYYLAELASRPVRGVIGTLVELLAAIPSVVLGLWGILVLGPFMGNHFEPWLHRVFGFIPLFGGSPSPAGLLPAGFILTIMVIPIVASISRELFLSVPREAKEGAYALGSTRWEVFWHVTLKAAGGGVVAALILGLGRALGEAIAVTQVIGVSASVHWSLFQPSDTIASRIAAEYQGAVSNLQISAFGYLAVILLVISLLSNLAARAVVHQMRRRLGFQ